MTWLYIFLSLLTFFIVLPKHTFLYRYSLAALFLLDCAVNALVLLGDFRETVSSRVGKAYLRGVKWVKPIMWLINLAFWPLEGDFNHCVRAIQKDVGDKTILIWK